LRLLKIEWLSQDSERRYEMKPKKRARKKARRPAPGGEALVRSVTFKPKAKKRTPRKTAKR
jgi:hypothetical protein